MSDRVERNEDGSLDEIVFHDCTVHIEQMNASLYFVNVWRGGEELFRGSFGAERGRVAFWSEMDGAPWLHRNRRQTKDAAGTARGGTD